MSHLKIKLSSGMTTIGSWITLGNLGIAEIMAKAGFDWLVVDLEHSTISIEKAGDLIRVIDLCNVCPLVRLTSNNPDLIKRVMDAGAHGVVVPMVNTKDDAARVVEAVYYPPSGKRGVGLSRAQGYGAKFADYLQWLKDSAVVIVQIEHINAVDNLESILSTKGVDGFIIGPYDLSASMGIPGQFDDPGFIKAMEKIRTVSQTMNVAGGIHIVEPDENLLVKAIEDGYKFIAYSLDIRILDVGFRKGMECWRRAIDAPNERSSLK